MLASLVLGAVLAAAPAQATQAPLVADKPEDGEQVAVMETSLGRIVLMFHPQVAPKHVDNFKKLAEAKFYDGVRFHRCIPGFMIQGGDPFSKDMSRADVWGTGGNVVDGKEVTVPAEFNAAALKHTRGILSMARSQDPNSASSQFFIMHADAPGLDGRYSAFGRVVTGLEVVDKIVATGQRENNGMVVPAKAAQIKTVRIAAWPVK